MKKLGIMSSLFGKVTIKMVPSSFDLLIQYICLSAVHLLYLEKPFMYLYIIYLMYISLKTFKLTS